MSKDEMGIQLPLGTRQSEPGIEQFEGLSDDEISDILAGHKELPGEEEEQDEAPKDDDGTDEPDKDEDEGQDKDDEPADEEDSDEEEEPAADGDDEPEAADDSDDKAELSPLEKRIAMLERRLELEGLERQRETEARKRAEMLASKQAGRAGFLQQKLKDKAKATDTDGEPAADASDDPWTDDESQSATEERREQPATSQGLQPMDDSRQELVAMAINDEGSRFAAEHAAQLEEMDAKYVERLEELIKEEAAPYAEEFRTAPVKTVRKLARSCMNSAFVAARIEMAADAEAQATTRQAESVAKSRRRKSKAAISTTGRRSAPPKPTKKSYEDMDLDELEAEMKKEFGENYRLGAQRGL